MSADRPGGASGVPVDGDEHEDLLQFLYQCPVGLVEVDDGGAVHRMNPAAARMLAPVRGTDDLSGLFGVLGRACPELVGAIVADPGRLGPVGADRRFLVGPSPGTGPASAPVVELQAVRVRPGRVMVVLLDVTEERRLALRNEALGARLRDLVAATLAYRQAAARVLGVSATAAAALEELLNRGPRTPSALARWLGVSGTSVTGTLDQLEGQGLVVRAPHPDDRRSTLVRLTPEGERRVAPLLELLTGGIDELTASGGGTAAVLRSATSALRTRARATDRPGAEQGRRARGY